MDTKPTHDTKLMKARISAKANIWLSRWYLPSKYKNLQNTTTLYEFQLYQNYVNLDPRLKKKKLFTWFVDLLSCLCCVYDVQCSTLFFWRRFEVPYPGKYPYLIPQFLSVGSFMCVPCVTDVTVILFSIFIVYFSYIKRKKEKNSFQLIQKCQIIRHSLLQWLVFS